MPKAVMLTPATWQAFLAGLFLATFLAWVWFAFIRPSTYSKWNAKRYAQTLPNYVLKGSPEELAVVADELRASAKEIVRFATDRSGFAQRADPIARPRKPTRTEICANQLLSLIADRRLCRVIVQSSPGTALALFYAIGETKKYGIPIEVFARNIVNEALENKDSFLYHETSGYETGLIGEQKPLSLAMFSNHGMVETIGTMLDPDFLSRSKWDADQWEAYCRIVLITFRDYVERGHGGHSYALYRALGCIKNASSNLYKLNGVAYSAWDDDPLARLRVIIDFIKKAVETLEKKGVPNNLQLRIRKQKRSSSKSFYDYVADLIFEVIFWPLR